MTVTHNDNDNEAVEETRINYAAEDTIDGERIHSVAGVVNGEIVTDCDRRPITTDTFEEQPRRLSGNNLCYDCVRAYNLNEVSE